MYPSKNKKSFIWGLCSLFVLLLTGCSLFSGNPTPTPTVKLVKAPADKQVYVIPQTGISDITTLDPALVVASDTASLNAIQMISTGLVSLDDHLQVHGQIAKSWEASSDGLTWTFHLRSGLKFSDGTPLTATDVAYSIDRALQPATKSSTAPNYLGLLNDEDKLLSGSLTTLIGDSIRVIDDNTLALVIRKNAPYFLSMLTFPCSYVVEKSLIDKYKTDFTNHLTEGGSTGPFQVSQYTHGKSIDFVPNQNYYGPQPQLRKVSFAFYPTAQSVYQAYQNGLVDSTGVPVETFATDKKRNDFHEVPQLWINYYTMNYLVKPFDNVHIRQAFALAIDKTAIAKSVWNNTVIPTNHIIPQGMDGYNPGLNGPDGTQNLSGNTTQAKTLLQTGLKEEGWSSISQIPPIKLTYATSSTMTSFDKEVTMMIQMWQQVLGITVTADPVDFNTLLDKVTAATNNAQGIQFWGLAWIAEYPDPYDWLTQQFGKGVVYNNMNYGQNSSTDATAQQTLQQQLEAADSMATNDARFKAYAQAEQQLVNDVAWLPMEQVQLIFLRNPFIVGITDNAQGTIPPDDWANIYKAVAA